MLTTPSGTLRATVRVAKTGPRAGHEAVLWFLTDEVGRIARPVRLLKHFEKQALAAGQTRDFTFDIDPRRDLTYPDGLGQPQLENGWYTLRVGSQAVRFRYAGGPLAQTGATPAGTTGALLRPAADANPSR